MTSLFRRYRRNYFIAVLVFSFFILVSLSTAQNLVPNPSFEDFEFCPEGFTSMSKKGSTLIPYWYIPGAGTPDYFNVCSKVAGVPQNFAGKQYARTGSGYAGLIAYDATSSNYREYIQAKLISPLQAGKSYCVRFYVCFASNSGYSVNNFGIYFSVEKIKQKMDSSIRVMPQVASDPSRFLDSVSSWVPVCGIYTPEKEEHYLTIGNFRNNAETKRKRNSGKKPPGNLISVYSYYFIDDVSVTLIDENNKCGCDSAAEKKNAAATHSARTDTVPNSSLQYINKEKPYVLKNIFFDVDKAILLGRSREELDSLVKFLSDNPSIKIEVGGHTDNTAGEEHNRRLSEARAKAVADYLAGKGVARDRVAYKGYGFSKPVADNGTEEGRMQNRRVEFIIIGQ